MRGAFHRRAVEKKQSVSHELRDITVMTADDGDHHFPVFIEQHHRFSSQPFRDRGEPDEVGETNGDFSDLSFHVRKFSVFDDIIDETGVDVGSKSPLHMGALRNFEQRAGERACAPYHRDDDDRPGDVEQDVPATENEQPVDEAVADGQDGGRAGRAPR